MAATKPLRYTLLGAMGATIGGNAVDLGSTRQRALLAALLIHRDQTLPRERILELLWEGSPPDTAAHSVEVYISRIRRALEPEIPRGTSETLIASRDGYRLQAGGSTDVDLFEEALSDAASAKASGDTADCEAALERALALWRGPALAGLHSFRFAQSEAARLGRQREAALEALIEAKLALGKHHEASALLSRASDELPLSEAIVALLMLARYRAGEAAEAVEAYYRFRRGLVDEFAMEPSPKLQDLLRKILNHDPALSLDASIPTTRLPRFNNVFVGRSGDLAVVSAMIQERRLVTITGMPGVGKTRLAVEVAAAASTQFRGGVHIVDLVSTRDGERFYGVLADALDLQEYARTAAKELALRFIAERRFLLVLDSCEYVAPDLKTILAELLQRCSNLHLLATSLVKLGVPEEKTWELEPLKLPGNDDAADLRLVEAVALFCDRAAESDSSFSLGITQYDAMRRVTRQLEGIPLAIELSAPRLKDLSLEQLAEKLELELGEYVTQDQGRPIRHRSLETAIATSFSTLTADQHQLLLTASLFRGGFNPDLAAAISGLPTQTIGGLKIAESLAERSLLRLDKAGRGSMLDSVRTFAERRLDLRPDAFAVRHRYVEAVAGLAWAAGSTLEGPGQIQAQSLLLTEQENIRESLAALLADADFESVMDIAGLLGRFWWVRGHVSEGQRWLVSALASPGPPTPKRAEALRILGYMNWNQGRLLMALENCQESMAMSRALGDPGAVARSHYYLGIALHQVGQIEAADLEFTQGVDLCSRLADDHMRGLTLDMLGRSLNVRDRSQEGAVVCTEALGLLRSTGDDFGVAVCLVNLAESLGLEGRYTEASLAYFESMEIFQALGGTAGTAYGLLGLAMVASRSGRPEAAVRLVGAAEAYWESVGFVLLPEDDAVIDATMAAATLPLGPSRTARLRAEGRNWAHSLGFFDWVRTVSQGV